MFLDDIGWNLKTVAVLGVHRNTVNQLVAVGELLLLELLFQIPVHLIRLLRRPVRVFESRRPVERHVEVLREALEAEESNGLIRWCQTNICLNVNLCGSISFSSFVALLSTLWIVEAVCTRGVGTVISAILRPVAASEPRHHSTRETNPAAS